MKLLRRLTSKLFNGRDGHSDHGSAPVEEGSLFDSQGYALYDSEGYALDTID